MFVAFTQSQIYSKAATLSYIETINGIISVEIYSTVWIKKHRVKICGFETVQNVINDSLPNLITTIPIVVQLNN
jgi:hypothetical protein